MRYLRWIGLVSTLLIGGVLGGLMAPIPSEASGTSVTLQVDGFGSPVEILDVLTGCADTANYNQCYKIKTTAVPGLNGRFFNASGASARLNVNDRDSLNGLKLTAVEFGPTTTNWTPDVVNEQHQLIITIKNTFDFIPDTQPLGVVGIRSGGYLQAGPVAISPYVTKYDSVSLEGKGTFCKVATCSPMIVDVPLANSPQGLAKAVGPNPAKRLVTSGANETKKSFTTELDQVTNFPTFTCKNANNLCTPEVTVTFTVTLKGPDKLVMSDSEAMYMAGCNLIPPGPPLKTPAIPCQANGKKSPEGIIIGHFATDTSAELGDPNAPPPNHQTNLAPGKITIDKQLEDTCYGPEDSSFPCTVFPFPLTFRFLINGPASFIQQTVMVTTDVTGKGSTTVEVIPTDPGDEFSLYSVFEDFEFEEAPNWHEKSGSTCGSGEDSYTTNFTVPTNTTITCTFTNLPNTD